MPSRGSLVRALVGVAISVVTIIAIVRGIDLAKVADILRTANPAWIAVTLCAVVVDLSIRSLRWKRLLAPIHPVPYVRTAGYLLIGYLANNVLPARLGELVRCHYLGDREGISRTTTLGTVVVERWPRVADIGRKLHGGLSVAGRPRTLGEALMLSGLAWSMTIISFAAAGQSIGIELSTAQAALLVSGVALATAIPAGPGNLGTFDLAGVLIASSFGLEREHAVALVVLAHAAALTVTSIGGAGALLRLGWARRPPVPVAESEAA